MVLFLSSVMSNVFRVFCDSTKIMNPRYQFYKSGSEGSFIVRVEGLEPPWIAPPDPKSGMSTNFTTPAFSVYSYILGLSQINPCRIGQPLKKECKFIDILVTDSDIFSKFR